MTNQEMIELLRDKAKVSYEEAEDALKRANWDPLDAVLLLEQDEKARLGGGAYSTEDKEEEEEVRRRRKERRHGAREARHWLRQTLRKLLRIGNANSFVVTRDDREQFSLSVTAFALLLIFAFWFVAVVMVVGLFCGLRYSFRGPNLGKQVINDAMNRAADMAENVKEDLMREE